MPLETVCILLTNAWNIVMNNSTSFHMSRVYHGDTGFAIVVFVKLAAKRSCLKCSAKFLAQISKRGLFPTRWHWPNLGFLLCLPSQTARE